MEASRPQQILETKKKKKSLNPINQQSKSKNYKENNVSQPSVMKKRRISPQSFRERYKLFSSVFSDFDMSKQNQKNELTQYQEPDVLSDFDDDAPVEQESNDLSQQYGGFTINCNQLFYQFSFEKGFAYHEIYDYDTFISYVQQNRMNALNFYSNQCPHGFRYFSGAPSYAYIDAPQSDERSQYQGDSREFQQNFHNKGFNRNNGPFPRNNPNNNNNPGFNYNNNNNQGFNYNNNNNPGFNYNNNQGNQRFNPNNNYNQGRRPRR